MRIGVLFKRVSQVLVATITLYGMATRPPWVRTLQTILQSYLHQRNLPYMALFTA